MKGESLLNLVRRFRNGVLGDRPSDLMCGVVSYPLEGYLNFLGIKCHVVRGPEGEHYWIELEDGRIIDATADQYNSEFRKMPKVYIGPKPNHWPYCERSI